MKTYLEFDSLSVNPHYNFINSFTQNSGNIDYQKMRLGYTAALMGDGFFSYDFGDEDHSQYWWFDEYDINLGQPLGKAVLIDSSSIIEDKFTDSSQWILGDWEMNTVIENGELSVTTTGNEEWNEFLLSKENLTINKNQELTLEFTLNNKSKNNLLIGYYLCSNTDTIWGENLVIEPGIHNINLLATSEVSTSEFQLRITVENSANFTIDNLALLTDEKILYKRVFENGVVYSNGGKTEATIHESSYMKFKGKQDSNHNDGENAANFILNSNDGIILIKDNTSISQTNTSKKITIKQIDNRIIFSEMVTKNSDIKIISHNGRIIYHKKLASNIKSFTIPSLSKGIYRLLITNNGSRISRSLIIK
jgi:hypothetical protein